MENTFKIQVDSEIGRLTGVVLHRPGAELANMTPESAQRALYSDILNPAVAAGEYAQLEGVLERWTTVFRVGELLTEVLRNGRVRTGLVRRICQAEDVERITDDLLALPPERLAAVLIEGVPLVKDNLSRFLSEERFSLPPLHNFFFMRDSAVAIGDQVLISRMANQVRGRETRIMEAIFDFHPRLGGGTVNPARLGAADPGATIEGGDVLVAAPDILVIGIGSRTTPQAVDFLIERFKAEGLPRHILVQKLPLDPESFIHLDMVFTLLDRDCCLVFEPVIMQTHRFDTVHIEICGRDRVRITEEDTLPAALRKLGMDLEPLPCGGSGDRWIQEREQWHSGANFFALAPGKVMGYGRNQHTLEVLVKAGFAVVDAADIVAGKADLESSGRTVVAVQGSELARGGGGCRCMTLPIGREAV